MPSGCARQGFRVYRYQRITLGSDGRMVCLRRKGSSPGRAWPKFEDLCRGEAERPRRDRVEPPCVTQRCYDACCPRGRPDPRSHHCRRQRIEHYEIAAYCTDVALAAALGEKEVAALLSETLEEEKQTDHKLTEVTQKAI